MGELGGGSPFKIPEKALRQLQIGDEPPDPPEKKDDPPPVARARATDPGTSWAAARALKAQQLRRSQSAVLSILSLLGEATDEAIAEEYAQHPELPDQSPSGLRTRRKELVDRGKVLNTGKTARLPSGRQSILWRVNLELFP